MEAYKSTCPDCKAVYFWTGFKTGIGKTAEQLADMNRRQSVCQKCGSTKIKTELDMESEVGIDLQDQYSFVADIITNAVRKSAGDGCPVCHEPAVKSCRCPVGDSECKNGHKWYHCPVHGTVFQGSGNHGSGSLGCQCPGGPGDGVRGL
jgi:hypothetical protein